MKGTVLTYEHIIGTLTVQNITLAEQLKQAEARIAELTEDQSGRQDEED